MASKDIANKGVYKYRRCVKGQMAGVAVMNLSGRPGAPSYNRIRGINSLDRRYGSYLDHRWNASFGRCLESSMGGTEFQETVLTSGIGISSVILKSITVLKMPQQQRFMDHGLLMELLLLPKRGSVGRSYINIQASYGLE